MPRRAPCSTGCCTRSRRTARAGRPSTGWHPNDMITLDDYFMGRDKQYAAELTEALRVNAGIVVARANLLLSRAGLKRGVNSGWRPAAVNASISNAAKESKHVLC